MKSRLLSLFRQKTSPASDTARKETAPDGKTTALPAFVPGLFRLLSRIALIALLVLLLLTKVFLITNASGNGMFPAVKDGDLLFAFRLQREYAKNDVVVYTAGQETKVGRIAALAGDVVMLDESGILLVNGTIQSGEILYPTYAGTELIYPYQVPEDSVFLLGDYRKDARDSREYGAVPLKAVCGKVITVLRRRGI